MNIPINFCTKCGNPKNAGERVCRFCGQPFYDDYKSLTLEDDDIDDKSEDTQMDDNQEVHQEKEMNQSETLLEEDCQSNIDSSDELTTQQQPENVHINVEQDNNGPEKINEHKPNYWKIPKKMGKYIIIVAVAAVIACAALFLININKEDSPEIIVKKAFNELKYNNYDEFSSYLDVSEKSRALINKLLPLLMKFYGENIKDVEVVNQEINDDKAKVNIKLIFNNQEAQDISLDLVKIDGNWKIKPIGDVGAGLDMLLGIGDMFGFDINDIGENIFDIFGHLF